MNEDQLYEFGIGGLALLLAFTFIPSLGVFFFPGIMLIAIIGVFFFVKGFAEFILGTGTKHLWIGVGLCLMIALLFNGTGVILQVFGGFLKLAAALINAVF